MAKSTDKANMFHLSTITLEHSMIINLILMALSSIKMDKNIKVTSKTATNMVKALIIGQMVPIMKDFIKMILDMVKENINHMINPIGKDNGCMEREKGWVH